MHSFVYETDKGQRTRLITVGALILLAAAIAISAYVHVSTGGTINITDFKPDFSPKQPLSMFTVAALSGIFFLFIPVELLFFNAIRAGAEPGFTLVAAVTGFALGNLISYIIGWKLAKVISALVSARKLHGARRLANKWGIYAILGMNIVPAPSPLLTFALGIARYNMLRLFILLILGNLVKLGVIAFVAA